MAKVLTKSQIGIFAEKIMDWGNILFAGLVIGQLVPGKSELETPLIIVGFLGISLAYAFAYKLMSRR